MSFPETLQPKKNASEGVGSSIINEKNHYTPRRFNVGSMLQLCDVGSGRFEQNAPPDGFTRQNGCPSQWFEVLPYEKRRTQKSSPIAFDGESGFYS